MGLTEIATTDVETASEDTPIQDCLETMEDRSVGSIVVTENGSPTGIVTDRMVALAMRDTDSIGEMTVGDVMTSDLVTADEDDTHFSVLETMRDEGIRRVPVVDGDELTAIITLDDLLLVTGTELNYATEVIEQQARPQ